MLDEARKMLGKADYRPYYLYRQKHMSGAQENTGYCLEGSAGIYNVRIMDEHQRIIAMGAGGISKAYDPLTRSLSRIPNVTNEEIYVERIGEMIERKRTNF
jgi:oxygen-independent coproporphyrinogen-3 oxidase